MKITKFLFDLGNVFFDWDPHYVFKNIIPDQTKSCLLYTSDAADDW